MTTVFLRARLGQENDWGDEFAKTEIETFSLLSSLIRVSSPTVKRIIDIHSEEYQARLLGHDSRGH